MDIEMINQTRSTACIKFPYIGTINTWEDRTTGDLVVSGMNVIEVVKSVSSDIL